MIHSIIHFSHSIALDRQTKVHLFFYNWWFWLTNSTWRGFPIHWHRGTSYHSLWWPDCQDLLQRTTSIIMAETLPGPRSYHWKESKTSETMSGVQSSWHTSRQSFLLSSLSRTARIVQNTRLLWDLSQGS